ncbi:MAG: hypothetical protein N2712_06760 [Brevinematales bacterium]|nr:hypothetical protein [Brevinematales bacterium]
MRGGIGGVMFEVMYFLKKVERWLMGGIGKEVKYSLSEVLGGFGNYRYQLDMEF